MSNNMKAGIVFLLGIAIIAYFGSILTAIGIWLVTIGLNWKHTV